LRPDVAATGAGYLRFDQQGLLACSQSHNKHKLIDGAPKRPEKLPRPRSVFDNAAGARQALGTTSE
jgi:hypothetical protein